MCLSIYLSAALPFEVSVELQFKDTETLNLTLYSLGNHSSLHFHPPKEEDGEEEGLSKDDGRQTKAFYCCLSVLPASGSAGQSQCLLWFTNHTVLLSMAKEQLLWKLPLKGRCQGKSLCSLYGQSGLYIKMSEQRGK